MIFTLCISFSQFQCYAQDFTNMLWRNKKYTSLVSNPHSSWCRNPKSLGISWVAGGSSDRRILCSSDKSLGGLLVSFRMGAGHRELERSLGFSAPAFILVEGGAGDRIKKQSSLHDEVAIRNSHTAGFGELLHWWLHPHARKVVRPKFSGADAPKLGTLPLAVHLCSL